MKDKVISIITALMFIVGFVCIGYVIFNIFFSDHQSPAPEKNSVTSLEDAVNEGGDCIQGAPTKSMRSQDMVGLIERGETFDVLLSYYDCNAVKKDHIVYFRVSESVEPVPRVVKALPGDKFSVTNDKDEDKTTWHIKVNDEWLKNSAGELFSFQSIMEPPLKTYEISRNGQVGPGEFIVLATVNNSISDSTKMGLVRKSHFDGRVIKKNGSKKSAAN